MSEYSQRDACVASPAAINVLAALLHARTGQQLTSARNWRIDTTLRPLLAEYEVETADQMVTLMLDGRDPRIANRVVDALLNQETSFFRDAAALDLAAEALAARTAPNQRPRIWSAGCASGQEPLSLAMLFAERAERAVGPMPEIVATDVSETALARARTGRYSHFEIQRGLPIRRLMRWFEEAESDWAASSDLLGRVTFRRHNLVADPAPGGLFDMILCRNVLFYLGADLRARVLDRFADAMRPGGLLMLGAGETVIGQSDRFRPCPSHRGLYEVATDTAVELRRAG